MKPKLDILAVELETNGRKLYYCNYSIAGERQIKMVHDKSVAILYTKEELKKIMPDLEKIINKSNKKTKLSVRKIDNNELYEYWMD